jgi:hypothetical protein
MSPAQAILSIDQSTDPQRLELIEQVWDSIPESNEDLPILNWQRLELIEQVWDSIPESNEDLPILNWHRCKLERPLAEVNAAPHEMHYLVCKKHLHGY